MSTAKKAAKKAPGRPKKRAGEKLEQFSIRLSPKLKLGLELLSRAQNRSLSQSVEWTIQVGLNSFEVDRSGTTLGKVLNTAWAKMDEGSRTLEIYNWAPSLLAFEDMATCEMVTKSIDIGIFMEPASTRKLPYVRDELVAAYWRVVVRHWPKLREIAIDRVNSGSPIQGVVICHEIGFEDEIVGRKINICDLYMREGERS